ncbi:type III-B CRISPR module RAMP protein Cmr1 [Candidatus Venteria ishoeyi]|uniref:CRISPR type III-associated protein domain-containing protein n=1 Tax=Candidatus Venteria ishoeyi TaxID=1899563 RepID=A0A1H6F878_9GAMM|nr:type III-B CRISPR module RAMP protein Cmr1 [Candidatus Venteria ishoeyi]SEH05254.1 Uncharacterised protein [Candidatus Venteria ishoeyi]
MPDKIIAAYQIVTPMFLGDAEQGLAPVNSMSFKGLMRFWWRALNWRRVDGNSSEEQLKDLHRAEAQLFGTANHQHYPDNGQSLFILQVKHHCRQTCSGKNYPAPYKSQSAYLGFGLFKMGEHKDRDAWDKHKHAFTVSLILSPHISTEQSAQLLEVLQAIGLWGSLGSRSRNGFGSIALASLTQNSQSLDVDIKDSMDYDNKIEALLNLHRQQRGLPPYTALSRDVKFTTSKKYYPDAISAHNAIGQAYYNLRGKDGTVSRPERVVFGLPLAKQDTENRRASPLFIHIHPVGKQFVILLLYIPAKFHTDNRYGTINDSPVIELLGKI